MQYISLRFARELPLSPRVMYSVGFISISLSFAYLAYLFIANDVACDYVWSRSSPDMPIIYRVSAIWSGGEGALLLWLWLMALVLMIQMFAERRMQWLAQDFHAYSQMALASMISVFSVVTLRLGLFEQTSHIMLETYPEGAGVSLILQTPEMVLHPPVIFAGYAACLGLFSVSLAHSLSGERAWHSLGILWGRASWIFLTLGIGIGAVWAYYVIGWGGYWYWDPVETSSLIPWLLATAFLHSMSRNLSKREYPVLVPLLGMLSFVAVLFAAFVTRSGGLWGSSVHTYGASSGANIGERLLNLLETDGTVLGFFALLLAVLAISLCVSYVRSRGMQQPQSGEFRLRRFSGYINDRDTMAVSLLLVITTTIVLIALMVKNTSVSPYASNIEFNEKMSVFFVAISISMSLCLAWRIIGRHRALYFVIALVVSSVALAAVAAVTARFDAIVAFSLPSYIAAFTFCAYTLIRAKHRANIRTVLYRASPNLVHMGTALILMSFVISTQLQSVPPQGEWSDVALEGEMTVGEFTVRLESITYYQTEQLVEGYSVTTTAVAEVDIFRSGKLVRDDLQLRSIYGGPSVSTRPDLLEAEVFVLTTLTKDLYLSYEWQDEQAASLHVKVVPMMVGLWSGLSLACVGATVRALTWAPRRAVTAVA